MKSFYCIITIAVFSSTILAAQNEKSADSPTTAKSANELKIEQGLTNIKKELEAIKKSIDSSNLSGMIKLFEESAADIEDIAEEIENIAEEIEDNLDANENDSQSKLGNADANSKNNMQTERKKDNKKERVHKNNRTKLHIDLSTGLTGLIDNTTSKGPSTAVFSNPEVKPWASDFFEIGLKLRTKFGKGKSRFSITYGLAYHWNNMDFSNGVKLKMISNEPIFVQPDLPVKSTALNIGYLSLPLGAEFRIGKKGKVGVGAYAGYRVRSVQKIKFTDGSEEVNETRTANYGLNNFIYGINAKIGVGDVALTANYNLSNMFKENKNGYVFNPYNLGLNFSF